MDPMAMLDEMFEESFQDFMQRGKHTETLVEEWERFYSKPAPKPEECPHGKTKLSCGKCYFN
jgi:hypothetical protein